MLAEPITRLVYQRGEFDAHSTHVVSTALFWFSFSLPFSGVNLLLTRTFFSLQRPWLVTRLSGNVLVNNVASRSRCCRSGSRGIVVGTAIVDLAMAVVQASVLRRELRGQLEAGRTLRAVGRMLAAAAVLGVVAYGGLGGARRHLGRSLPAQVCSVGLGVASGLAVYAGIVLALRVPEAERIARLVRERLAESEELPSSLSRTSQGDVLARLGGCGSWVITASATATRSGSASRRSCSSSIRATGARWGGGEEVPSSACRTAPRRRQRRSCTHARSS